MLGSPSGVKQRQIPEHFREQSQPWKRRGGRRPERSIPQGDDKIRDEETAYGNRSPIFIQILLRHIIFRHFVSFYLALIRIQSTFYALNTSASKAFPSSSNSSTLSELAVGRLDNPCKSPDSPSRLCSLPLAKTPSAPQKRGPQHFISRRSFANTLTGHEDVVLSACSLSLANFLV